MKFDKFGSSPKSINLYFLLIAILPIKFGWNWIKPVGAVVVENLRYEILQSAQTDLKINSKNDTGKI